MLKAGKREKRGRIQHGEVENIGKITEREEVGWRVTFKGEANWQYTDRIGAKTEKYGRKKARSGLRLSIGIGEFVGSRSFSKLQERNT